MKYAIFTVCLPEFTPEQAAAKLEEYGYDGVEWRVCNPRPGTAGQAPSYWGNNLCTVEESDLGEKAGELRQLAERHGLETCALGTYLRSDSPAEDIEAVMLGAKAVGAGQIRISPAMYDGSQNYRELFEKAVEDYRAVESLAKKHGVKVNLEMHMNTITASASAAYRLVSHFDPAYIGVIYDTGNVIFEGHEEYQAALEILGEYLAHVHVKNGKWRPKDEGGYAPGWAPIKDGHADFDKFFKALHKVGYDGWVSFEDFSDGLDADEKLRDNLAYIKEIVERTR